MREFVGVKPANDFIRRPSLKREALIFDRVAIAHYTACEAFIKLSSVNLAPEYIRELNWLIESGIVFEVNIPMSSVSTYHHARLDQYLDLLNSTLRLAMNEPNRPSGVELVQENVAKLCALALRLISELDAYPISSKFLSFEETTAPRMMSYK